MSVTNARANEGELCDECVDNEVDTNNGEDVIFNKGT